MGYMCSSCSLSHCPRTSESFASHFPIAWFGVYFVRQEIQKQLERNILLLVSTVYLIIFYKYIWLLKVSTKYSFKKCSFAVTCGGMRLGAWFCFPLRFFLGLWNCCCWWFVFIWRLLWKCNILEIYEPFQVEDLWGCLFVIIKVEKLNIVFYHISH